MWVPLGLLVFFSFHLSGVVGQNINPVFTNTDEIDQKLLNIPENISRSEVIVRAVAVEGDRTITYFLEGTGASWLDIDETTGDITRRTVWDYDREDGGESRGVDVCASDDETHTTCHRTAFSIANVNDNKPEFVDTSYSIDLPEDTEVGFQVAILTVTDIDVNKNRYLRIFCERNVTDERDDACEVFVLKNLEISNKRWRGALLLNRTLDYERQSGYTVGLYAYDGDNPPTYQGVQITVEDVNDSPPFFVYAESISVNETVPVQTSVTYVSARDKDEADPRPIRYELIGDDEALQYFDVTSEGGIIKNLKVLDYEDPNHQQGEPFKLQIKARELLSPSPNLTLGNDATTTAVTTIFVTVDDINDNCPRFEKPKYSVLIQEDITADFPVPVQLRVEDDDVAAEHKKFTLKMVDPTGTFALVNREDQAPATVSIRLVDASNLDYESNQKTYTLTIEARDPANSLCLEKTEVEINLQDVNDETPEFLKSVYEATVPETAAKGTSVITVKATDKDSGTFGNNGLRYSFSTIEQQNLFSIDRISGVVTVEDCGTPGRYPCLDYERVKSYSLSVKVADSDGSAGARIQFADLLIKVLDENDNVPEFIGNYTRYIREGSDQIENGLTIHAIDKDDDNVTYSIIGNADSLLWRVNPVTGEVTPTRNISTSDLNDRDRGSFIFDVTAFDGEQTTTATVTIIVIDINDNTPVFQPSQYTVNIPEDFGGDKSVIQVSVTDADSPSNVNGQVVVAIDSGSSGKFAVKSSGTTGAFFLAEIYTEKDAVFDYDRTNRYVLTLKGRDKGNPPNTGTATVTVNILDINNRDPFFQPPTTSAEVYENEPVSTSVTQVTAIDRDEANELVISFGSPVKARNPSGGVVDDQALLQNLFTITNDGLVRTNQLLDRDTVSFVELPLVVVDVKADPRQTGTGSLYIRILEYNDQAPQFELPFYSLSVEEERARGSFVASIVAVDEDDQIESYQLTLNPFQLFTLSLRTGVLTVNGRLDYETRHNVSLIARASDSGSPQLSNTTNIFIRIININDNTPVFSETIYQVNIPEHLRSAKALTAVYATDEDEEDFGVVRYTANDPFFTVDQFTGEVFLKPDVDLDRENISTHTFQVTAYDSPLNASVRLNTTTQVYIVLDDINDNCPEFTETGGYSESIIETADVGDQVLEMFATDRDDGYNSNIKFTIDAASAQPPVANELFTIYSIHGFSRNMASGRIEVLNSLRNQSGTYTFTVVASDQNGENITGNMCSRKMPVTIRVQEAINDAPEWVLPPTRNFSIDVLESQYRGMLVYDCKAKDRNTGKDGIVDYYFNFEQVLSSTTPEFRINRVTGVISARIVFDREQVSSYVLTVVAKDQGNPSASSETVLIVEILDVNDNEPEFPMRNGQTVPYRFTIPEGVNPAVIEVIGTVSATDKDTDHKNNKVYYRIVAGNDDGFFLLGRESGDLRLNPSVANGLDREHKSSYKMDVLAYNEVNDDSVIRYRRKRSTNPSIVTVEVTVEDVNDTPPRFVKADYRGCVPRDAPFGYSILHVEAEDQDLNRKQYLTYSKISETTGDFFSVDQSLGTIRNAKLLYDITSRVSVVRVRAEDTVDDQEYQAINRAETEVKIFVTDTENEVKLVVTQPSAYVRDYQDQLIRVMINSSSNNPISFVCIREIRDHIDDEGSYSYTSSDVFLSAVYPTQDNSYKFYSGEDLSQTLNAQLGNYQTLHVKSVEVESEDDELSLTEDAVLAVFIIAILLIFLAIILVCLACCMIRNSKKKKMKKLRAVSSAQHAPVAVVMHQPAPEVGTNVNPVYDNQGFQGEDEYAVVQKKRPAPEPVGPPIIPVIVPAVDDEPTPEEPPLEPEPVIITEPLMSEEPPVEMQPPPADFFDPDPVTESPYEPVIETVIETDVPDDEDPDYIIPPAPVETSLDDEIDVEFRDIQDTPSPPRSASPPAEDEFVIESDVM